VIFTRNTSARARHSAAASSATGGAAARGLLGIPRQAVAVSAAVVSVALVVVGLSFGAASASAAGTSLIQDTFTTNSLNSTEYLAGGTGSTPTNVACLTVQGSAAGSIPASCVGTTDTSGNGALRLNPAVGGETGYLLYNHPLPTKAGLSISFDQYQYGTTNSAADGIGFFLADGAYQLTSVGASGGSLGYGNSVAGSGIGEAGLPHALLGVGLDAYGNFVHETNNTPAVDSGTCPVPDATWTAALPNAVAIRGPGLLNSAGVWKDGYCLLGKGVVPAGGISSTAKAGNRNAAVRVVTVVIDPPTNATPMVSVYMGPVGVSTNATMTLITSVPEPAILATTPTFKFGWSSSTGGSNDINEVSNLVVATVNTLPAVLDATATSPAASNVGTATTATFQSSLEGANGPVASGIPVTQTITAASGVTFGSLPATSNGWVLQSGSTSSQAVYKYTPAAEVLPGDSLPDLSVPVVGTAAGKHSVTSVLTGGGMTITSGAAQTATSSVTVLPTVSGMSYTTAPASAAPVAESIAVPAASGVSSPVYSIVSGPSKGTATMDASTGVISYTPAASTSDVTSLTYQVTDNGQTSTPATVTITTPPAATSKTKTVDLGATATVDLSAGASGTAALSYQLVSPPPAAAGKATVSGSTLTFVPASGFSGSTTMTFTDTDPNTLVSKPATVTINVNPGAATKALTLTLGSDGNGAGSDALPAPSGSSGPYTYQVASQPSSGSVVVHPDGTYTYTAANGGTGIFTGSYTVTDSSGNISKPATITFTVIPYAAPVSGATTPGVSVTLPAPSTAGAAGGTFAVTQPASGGTANIDASTGVVTFVPSSSTASGPESFTYTVTANGETSSPATVIVNIKPLVTDHTGSTPFNTATSIDLTPGAVGSSLSYSVVTAPDASVGTASIDPSTGLLSFTPTSTFSGVATVTYKATGTGGLSSAPATVTIKVHPRALPDSMTMTLASDGTASQNASLPTPDGSSAPYAFSLDASPASGTLIVNSDGTYSYTAAKNVDGTFTATYAVTDTDGNSSPDATITITVLPYAAPVSGSTTSNTPVTLGTPTTAGTTGGTFAITQPSTGSASVDPSTGKITFTPKTGTSGIVTFSYTVTVNGVTSAPEAVTVNVRPTVTDKTTTTPANTAKTVDLTAGAIGTGLSYSIVTAPDVAAGTASVDPTTGVLTFTPATNYSGTAVMTFKAVDSDGLASNVAKVSISVPPQAATASPAVVLSANGSGTVDGSLPTPTGTSGPYTYAIATQPGSGTVVVNPDGTFTYTAAPNGSGIFTGTYTVTDGSGNTSTPADLTFTVKPYAAPVTDTTTSGTTVTPSAPATAGGTGGTFTVTQPTSGGTASIDPTTGVITLVPTPGTSGIVTFTYAVTANGVQSDAAPVTVDVDPTVTDHSGTTSVGVTKTIDLTPGANGSNLVYSIVSGPSSAAGTATVDPSTGVLSYIPASSYSGNATITYRVTDPDSLVSSTKTVTIAVLPTTATTAPTVILPTDGTTKQTFPLPAPTGTGPFTYTIVPGSTPASDGTFAIDPATGVVTYTPVPGLTGTIPAEYTVTDGSGNTSAHQPITLTVLPYIDDVSSTADAGSTSYPLPVPVAAGSGPLTYTMVSGPKVSLGSATINPATGVITYVPVNPNASGPVTATYTVTDASNGTSSVATATLLIRPRVNDVSGTVKGAILAPPSLPLKPTPLGTGAFTYSVVGATPHVTVSATSTGFKVTPDPGYHGTTTFKFLVVDASGTLSETQTATVHVLAAPGGGLAFTGTNGAALMIWIGFITVLAGILLMAIGLLRRRRNKAEAPYARA
jgi:hypothetical protein